MFSKTNKEQVEAFFDASQPVAEPQHDLQKPVAVAQYLLRLSTHGKGEYLGQALSQVKLRQGNKIIFQDKRYKIIDVVYVRKAIDNRNIATVKPC